MNYAFGPKIEGGGRHTSDIGVAYLKDAVQGIRPMEWRPLTKYHRGRIFKIVGYGQRSDKTTDNGLRYQGYMKLVSISGGLWYQNIFGDYSNYKKHLGDLGIEEDKAKEEWGKHILAVGYEAFLKPFKSEADGKTVLGSVNCSGDSGGPLLRRGFGGRYYVYGVASAGESLKKYGCGYASNYAAIHGEVIPFLKDSFKNILGPAPAPPAPPLPPGVPVPAP